MFDATWIDHEISGSAGSKFDRIELVDLDGDGDLDAMTTEENFGPDSLGMGVIWYENPTIVSFAAVGQKQKLSEGVERQSQIEGVESPEKDRRRVSFALVVW